MNGDTRNLNICLVQTDIRTEDKQANIKIGEQLLHRITQQPDIIVFPELFSCGYSEGVKLMAEDRQGESIAFLKSASMLYHSVVIAGIPMLTPDGMVNRMLWVDEGEITGQYDKKHLFFGCEKEYFVAGNKPTVCTKNGWNCRLITCYDIRFPMWCRNKFFKPSSRFMYDILIVIANFPAARAMQFDTLLRARAIENQCYVLAVNRIGKDGYGNLHQGNTQIISPQGRTLAQVPNYTQNILEYTLSPQPLSDLRSEFPIGEDWD
ncbi:MAG: nitrilase family protein [Bacteroidales bacterium]|nr:nitrilase family protein [Bacteroidales bacterium]